MSAATSTIVTPDVSAPSLGGLEWGREREMNALEALMWRAEGDPRLRSTLTGLELLDRAPEWERFLAAHDWATRMVPRFRQRVVEPPLGVGIPSWAVDPDFDLHYHVRRVRLPEPGTWRQLLAICEQLAMTPFDRARSPWEAVLVEGLPDARAAYMLKLHHATTDGIGGIQLLTQLHSPTREPDLGKPQPPPPVAEIGSSAGRRIADQLVRNARGAGGLAGGLLGRAGEAIDGIAHADRALRETAEFAASLQRVLGGPEVAGSPLLAARSMSWRFATLDLLFADLRAASKAAGSSVNDAFLAALLGGFRRYHLELGAEIELMPIAIPISVRREGDSQGGNRIAGAQLAAPAGIADPRERMAQVGAAVRAARAEPAIESLALVAPALAQLPAPLISRIAGGLTKTNDLQASNVPGIREPRYLAGAHIERMYGFGPLPGCASMITLITHEQTCCVAINVDLAAITEPERFARCVCEGFDEVLALSPGAEPVRLR